MSKEKKPAGRKPAAKKAKKPARPAAKPAKAKAPKQSAKRPAAKQKKPAANKATGKQKTVKGRKRSTGWARTKEYPHKRHPAYYRKQKGDSIEYVTFTHSSEVDLGKEKVTTQRLNKNIDYKNKGENRYSHVLQRVYEGERSALGKGTNDFRLDKSDQGTVDNIFNTGKRYPVPRTGGKAKQKKPGNPTGQKKRK